MSVSSTGKVISPRQKRVKLKGETTVETQQGQSSSKEEKSMSASEESNKLQVRDTFAIASRPVSSSELEVVETVNVMGIRPIAAHNIEIVDTINLSGIRPIASSHLVISDTYSVMGNRPVASNEIDDGVTLMGFLD
jgi:ribosomal protein S17